MGYVPSAISQNYVDPYEEYDYSVDRLQATGRQIDQFEENMRMMFARDTDGVYRSVAVLPEYEEEMRRRREDSGSKAEDEPVHRNILPPTIDLPQLERLSASLRKVIRNDAYFRAVLTTLKTGAWFPAGDMDNVVMRSGLTVQTEKGGIVLCAPVAPLNKDDPLYKQLQNEDESTAKSDDMADIEYILAEYAKSNSHSEQEEDRYMAAIEDHLRFAMEIEDRMDEAHGKEYRIVKWFVELI